MKKFLLLCFIGYLLYVVFHDDEKQPSDTVVNASTSQSAPTKNGVNLKPKTGDANISSKSISPNVDSPRTSELDNKAGSKLIEKVEPPVKSEPSLEDQYNQRNARVNRQFQWCENFSKNLEYYVCRHQNPTDYTHKKDWHLALHSSQRLILFGGNDYPYYGFASSARGLNRNSVYDEIGFEPYDREGGRVILKAHNGRRIIEFNSSNGKLFFDVSLLSCRKESKMSNEVKVTVCQYGFPIDHPKKDTTPRVEPKPLEVSPMIESDTKIEYKPTEFK